ncbi:MAG: DUF3244 domain-containing protein [Flammeovirgaceae bacterium]
MKVSVKTFALVLVLLASITVGVQAEGNGKGGKKAKAKKESAYSYQAAINLHQDNTVAVHFMKPTDQKVTISIKDQNGKIVHYEAVKKHDLVVKKYEMSTFPKGAYRVIVKNGDEVLEKSIQIK